MATVEVVSAASALIVEEKPEDQTIIVTETTIFTTKEVVAEPEPETVTGEEHSKQNEELTKDEVKEVDNYTEQPNVEKTEDQKPVIEEKDVVAVDTPVKSAPEPEVAKHEEKPVGVEEKEKVV